MTRQPEWFDAARIRTLLPYPVLIAALERGLRLVEAGEITEQRDSGIRDAAAGTGFLAYPASWPAAGLATMKILSTVRGNLERGLPLIHAVVVVIDARTGEMRALLEGGQLTAMRTAAMSAIAAARGLAGLERPGLTVAVIGTGAQAFTHVEAFAAHFPTARIVVASGRDDAHRLARFTEELEGRAVPMLLRAAIEGADVIACCTAAHQPLFLGDELKPDAVVTSIAPFLPGSGEISAGLVRGASLLLSDDPARVVERWGAAPLPEVVGLTGEPVTPRSGHRVFLSCGRPFADLVASHIVLKSARELSSA